MEKQKKAVSQVVQNYAEYFKKHKEKILEDFFTFLRFQSVSTDPAYKKELLACFEWVKNYVKAIGFKVEKWEVDGGHPCLFATHIVDPKKPTLLLYNHYDVQPVDPLDLWKTPPFFPEVRNGNVYARGAIDNKGQCFYTLSALKAFFEFGKKESLNIKLLIEGEEEIGSDSLVTLLKEKKEQVKADGAILVDLGIPSNDTPTVTLGFRGLVTFDIECTGSNTDLHSGSFGGIAYNPLRALSELFASVFDEKGKITIPHFYDGIKNSQINGLVAFDEKSCLKDFAIAGTHKEDGYSMRDSNWQRPTFEINGMHGGYTGVGFKTVIPAKAFCKVSCRLVPGQDADHVAKCVKHFLESNIKKGMQLKVKVLHTAEAHISSSKGDLAQKVKSAYEESLQKETGFSLSGGTLPIAGALMQATGAETIGMGFALDTDLPHAPNEHFALDRFEQGFKTVGVILENFAK